MEHDQSSASTPESGHSHPEDEMDHCVCDLEMSEDETTDDSALPAAEGGVAADDD